MKKLNWEKPNEVLVRYEWIAQPKSYLQYNIHRVNNKLHVSIKLYDDFIFKKEFNIDQLEIAKNYCQSHYDTYMLPDQREEGKYAH